MAWLNVHFTSPGEQIFTPNTNLSPFCFLETTMAFTPMCGQMNSPRPTWDLTIARLPSDILILYSTDTHFDASTTDNF